MDGVTEENRPKSGNRLLTHDEVIVTVRKAAHRLELEQCAMALELAADLRSGHMDSESRAQEVQRQVRLTLIDVAARLRTLSGL